MRIELNLRRSDSRATVWRALKFLFLPLQEYWAINVCNETLVMQDVMAVAHAPIQYEYVP